jgi:hypothetical protein
MGIVIETTRYSTLKFIVSWALTCLAGYVLMEALGSYVLDDLPQATKKICSRSGIVLGYLGGLVAGMTFLWDAKANDAERLAITMLAHLSRTRALLQDFHSSVALKFDRQLAETDAQIDHFNGEAARAQEFARVRFWLGRVSLGALVCGSYLQFLGET